MNNRTKFKSISKLYFIVPLIVIIILFSLITFVTVSQRVDENFEIMKEESMSLGRSYSFTLAKSNDAENIINELLEQKLSLVSQMIANDDNIKDNDVIDDYVELYTVDAIYYYNADGVVIYTNFEEHLGWTATEGHPVKDFMDSSLSSYVGPIRADSETGVMYKYGYYKLENGDFVQIGILADTIYNFLANFDLDLLLERMAEDNLVDQLCFIDENLTIINSTNENVIGTQITNPEIVRSINNNEIITSDGENDIYGEFFQVYVPVYDEDIKVGTLLITRSTDYLNEIELVIVRNGIIILSLIVGVLGVAVYLIYNRSKNFLSLAYYDTLTNLPNASYLKGYLRENLSRENSRRTALFLIDISNFNTINLTYGYKYGDLILKKITDRLLDILRNEDILFRFTQDRFVLLLQEYVQSEDLIRIANEVEKVFHSPFKSEKDNQYVSSKIAIIEINNDDDVDTVIRNASIALDYTKDEAHKYAFFTDSMQKNLEREHHIETELKRALEENDNEVLFLNYQPMIESKNMTIKGFEALARMKTSEEGLIPPLEFIKVAESKLLISDLGRYLFEKAMIFLNKFDKETKTNHVTMSVNVSIIELLRGDYVSFIKDTANKYAISLERIEIEVTESIFENRFDLINVILGKLKEIGCKISLDDFGTGYSSFSRLREMNMNTMKIDKYFIDKITDLNKDDFIVEDIITLSHKLGFEVVAEGVETKEQVNYLKKINCDYLQGYFLSKPLEEEKALSYVQETLKK